MYCYLWYSVMFIKFLKIFLFKKNASDENKTCTQCNNICEWHENDRTRGRFQFHLCKYVSIRFCISIALIEFLIHFYYHLASNKDEQTTIAATTVIATTATLQRKNEDHLLALVMYRASQKDTSL